MKSFRSPKEVKISGRSSSITGAFANSIVPNIKPSSKELSQVYKILNLNDDDLRCSYCGDRASEWDHFRATVNGKRPTGYLAEVYNLVPSCGKCNQSKGGVHWKTWINSTTAKLSPKNRRVRNLKDIIKRLQKFENWSNKKVTNVGYPKLDKETQILITRHWKNWKDINTRMQSSQKLAEKIKSRIKKLKGWD